MEFQTEQTKEPKANRGIFKVALIGLILLLVNALLSVLITMSPLKHFGSEVILSNDMRIRVLSPVLVETIIFGAIAIVLMTKKFSFGDDKALAIALAAVCFFLLTNIPSYVYNTIIKMQTLRQGGNALQSYSIVKLLQNLCYLVFGTPAHLLIFGGCCATWAMLRSADQDKLN